jgi:hypothetical protein
MIGQWGGSEARLFEVLKKDGAIVLQDYLAVALPWTKAPLINVIVGVVCREISAFIAEKLDALAYAGYVAVATGKQVSEYIEAIDSGDKDRIDKAADDLVHLGGL